MPKGTRRRAVVALLALALVPSAAVAGARTLPRGAVRLAPSAVKRADLGVLCGRIAGRWVSGTRIRSWWFISDSRQARDLAAAARGASGRAHARDLMRAALYRRRAAERRVACGPLRFRLRGAVGLALRSSSRYRGTDLSNLDVVTARGKLREAVTSGSADVSRFFTAPNGKVYVLFRYPVRIDPGAANSGDGSCDSTGDGSGDTTGDGSGDTSGDTSGDSRSTSRDASGGDPCSDAGAIYCLLAEVDAQTSQPTCVDTSLTYVRTDSADPGLNDPVQFDAQGAVYYMGTADNRTVVRRSLNGTITDYLTTHPENLLVNDFVAVGDGDVLITGMSVPTKARWVRRVGADGGVHTVRSFSAGWMRMFPDGNAYIGFWGSGDYGIRRFSPAAGAIDDSYWLTGDVYGKTADTHHDAADVCRDADRAARDAFCDPLGSLLTGTVTTSTGRVYAIAGTPTSGRLVELYPDVVLTPSAVRKVSVAEPVGQNVALAGVDAGDRQVLVLHDTATDQETTLIGPDAETEIYHLGYDAKANHLLFDGLRFADDRYVLGDVDLATGTVSIDDSGTKSWTQLDTVQTGRR